MLLLRASGCPSWFGVIIIWGQCILPLSTPSQNFCLPLLSPPFFLSFQTSGEYKCIATDVTFMEFYPQVSCYRSTWPCPVWDRRVSSLFFLSLCSLTSKQLFPSLISLQKCFHLHSPLMSYLHITQLTTWPEMWTSVKNPSAIYTFSSRARNILNLEDSEQAMCPFTMSAVRFKWDHSKLCFHLPNCF